MKKLTPFAALLAAALMFAITIAKESTAERKKEKSPPVETAVLDRIETSEIVFRDNDGAIRGRIGFDGQNVMRFTAGPTTNSDSFALSVFPDGRTALLLRDSRGRNRVGLSLHENGRPVISMTEDANIILRDSRGRNRAVLRAPNGDDPHLLLYDEEHNVTTYKAE